MPDNHPGIRRDETDRDVYIPQREQAPETRKIIAELTNGDPDHTARDLLRGALGIDNP